jgi:hypothetical protein
MNDTPTSLNQNCRTALIDAILLRIEQDVEDALPPDTSKTTHDAILAEILPNSRFVLEGLSSGQLENEFAIDRHIERAIATATYLVHRIEAQRSRVQ